MKGEKKKLRELIFLYTKEIKERLEIHQEILLMMADDWGKDQEVDDNLIELLEDLSMFQYHFPPLANDED